MSTKILGISAYYHDSAAALVINGEIVAAAQEERFSRKKHDPAFPGQAIKYCLEEAHLNFKEIDYIVFYDKPLIKFERLLETYLSYAPIGFTSFIKAMPVWLKEKLFLKSTLKKEFRKLLGVQDKNTELPKLLFSSHHQSHAASAFYPSPFERAAVLCLDGVGEWTTTSVWLGDKANLELKWEMNFPHSLGLLYSAFTYYTGFRVNSGEYKLMGLAPYGEPKYVDLIYQYLIDVKNDGSYRLNMKYFNYATGLTMTNERFNRLLGGKPRLPESEITQREMDLARSIQVVIEETVLKMANNIYQAFKIDNLCLAGGVALNCVSNGRLLRESSFKQIWIQPAAGDAGGAIGASLIAWHEHLKNPRESKNIDGMQGAYLGPHFKNKHIAEYLDSINAAYRKLPDQQLMPYLAELLAEQNVIGWMQGRMEFGPRALGGRSILGDPRSASMQSTINLKIKYRESFRPFAPAVKLDKLTIWFETEHPSPYMLLVDSVKKEKCFKTDSRHQELTGIDKLKVPRSELAAVTHVDYSARIQSVCSDTNPRFYALLDAFEQKTGCPVLINTSFNVRGEPIVCTPEDAYRCFMRTEMDYLVIENFVLAKKEQSAWNDSQDWQTVFEPD